MQKPALRIAKWTLILLLSALCPAAQQEIIPIKDIEPGMVGYGLSVFHGNHIEKFQVQVIDIMEGFLPGEPIILVRCSPTYGNFDINRSGLIAGMSGSPIYFDGKLAGALAMGWSFAKEPLAGITPIETMLKIANRPLENKIAQARPISYPAVGGLIPLKTPLMVSGITPNTFGKLQSELKRYGWVPVYGGGGKGKAAGKDYRLVPGAALGAQLISGDMNLTAIGTVTWVDKDRVLAFGHSFFNAGEFFMPITTAHISTIMESKMISFKLGYPVKQVGTLLQDRLAGIYGKMGKVCAMLPMTINIENKVSKEQRAFHIEVIRSPFLSSRLCTIAVFNFLDMQEATWGENTTWVRTKVYVKGEEPFTWSNMYANSSSLGGDFTGPLKHLYQNPFKIMEVEKIEVDIEVMHELLYADIFSVHANALTLAPGDNLELEVDLRPLRAKNERMSISLKIPQDTPSGDYIISVMGGGQVTPNLFQPENTRQYLKTLRKINRYKNNQLVISLSLPKIKVLCRGREMSDLPDSVIGNLLPVGSTRDIQVLTEVCMAAKDTPYVISGGANVLINVKSPSADK